MHYSSSSVSTPHAGWIDNRLAAATRLILAASALLAVSIDSSGLERYAVAARVVLALHLVYAALLYGLASRHSRLAVYGVAHWIDIVWYSALLALSSGSDSIFFFFYFFAILSASFRWGFTTGWRVALISAMLFTVVGIVTALSQEVALNRLLLRLVFLLALGHMIARWGGLDISLKHRLSLLKEVTALANPRFGVDHTMGLLLERLRSFYDADACLLATMETAEPGQSEPLLRRADRHNAQRAMRAETMAPQLAERLLSLPPDQAVVYSGAARGWLNRDMSYFAYDVVTGEPTDEGRRTCEMTAFVLDAESLTSVPLRHHNQPIGRLFLTSKRRQVFHDFDAEFLIQIMEQVLPVIQNIRLVDRLASDAADDERQRIARDLHDSVIQPYIGLQNGLAAVQRKLASGRANVSADVETLSAIVSAEIIDLRRYVRDLRDGSERDSAAATLLPAVRRFAAKFAGATGIAVRVEAENDIVVNDRLAAEAFQMVVEGLSNIRTHTQSERATIHLQRRDSHLVLRIHDLGGRIPDAAQQAAAESFTPRSITERAVALGGQARVERDDQGTAVIVEIPL